MKNWIFILLIIPCTLYAQDAYRVDDCLQLKGVVKLNTKIYAEPDLDAHDRAIAEKFEVLYMFQHDGTGNAKRNGFYRVGKMAQSAIGYVYEDDIVEWNHRLCLSFTDQVGRSPALIYKSLNDVKEEDWDSNKKPNRKAIGQEPTENKDLKYDMLLPVLEQKSIERKGDNRENIDAYKIGFLGETGGGGGTISKPAYVGKSKLDLMFLIDATGSMADEIQGAKQVVRSITNSLKSMENTEVRIGISLYKDFGDEFVSRKWQSLTTDYSKVLSKLASIEVSAGGDTEEAMYQGVLATMNTTNWSKGEQSPVLREILIIGDAPGHEYGGDYTTDASDLITKASENRVRFIALKINTGYPSIDDKHQRQLSDMTDGLRDGDKGLYMEANAFTGSMSDDYLNKLSSAIKSEIQRLKELESVRSGAIRLEDVTPTNRAVFIKNLPSSGFEDIGVHFSQGWISEKNSNGTRQVEPFVYMTYADLTIYKFVCQAAIAIAQSESADMGIMDLTKDKLTALSGEAYDSDMELDEHLRKTLCLPAGDSGILKYSLSEIFRWSKLRKDKFILTIDDKVQALDQILRDNSVWRKPAGSDLRYTFVKLDLMP